MANTIIGVAESTVIPSLNPTTSYTGDAANSEAWAIGKRNGTPVVAGDEAYHNNSKYYKELAGESATSAITAKEAAVAAEAKIESCTATATVNESTGTPSVVVTKTELVDHFNLGFAFSNLKGEKGDCNFAEFSINPSTGILSVSYTKENSGLSFSLKTNGHLEVNIG